MKQRVTNTQSGSLGLPDRQEIMPITVQLCTVCVCIAEMACKQWIDLVTMMIL